MEALQIVRLIGPEFAATTDEEVEQYIELVRPMVSRNQFAKLYEHGVAYLACHKMKVAGLGENPLGDIGAIGVGLAVSSVSEGGSSISFGSSQSGSITPDAELGMTVYGVQFLQLRRHVIIPIHCSGESVI